MLGEAMAGNASSLYTIARGFGRRDMARSAVTCADNTPYSRTNTSNYPEAEELADVALNALKKVSRRWALSTMAVEPDGGCQYWPTNKLEDVADGTAAERFNGPWNHTLRNPILINSNLADP